MELFNDWGGQGYDDSVPGEVTKTAPSGDRITGSPTWSASLPRINSTHSTRELVRYVPGWGYFRPVPSQNGDKLVSSPLPPQSLDGLVGYQFQNNEIGSFLLLLGVLVFIGARQGIQTFYPMLVLKIARKLADEAQRKNSPHDFPKVQHQNITKLIPYYPTDYCLEKQMKRTDQKAFAFGRLSNLFRIRVQFCLKTKKGTGFN